MNHLIGIFADYLHEQGFSSATMECYARDARGFLDFIESQNVDIKRVDTSTMAAYREHLIGKHVRDNSIRRTILGIRSFYRFLEDQKLLAVNTMDQTPIPQRIDKPAPTISVEKLSKLFAFAKTQTPEFKATRDEAILSLLGFEGLKVNEIIDLSWADFIESKTMPAMLHVPGLRPRTIELCETSQNSLLRYREQWLKRVEALEEKKTAHFRMFNGFKGKDSQYLLPNMSRHGIKFILYELGTGAGIEHLNSEMLRHLAVQNLFLRGLSTELVMQHLGLKQLGIVAYYRTTAKHDPTSAT